MNSSFDKEDVDDYYASDGEGHDSREDEHPPLSPATGAESLFLAGLATSAISARALSEQLRQNSRSVKSSSDSNLPAVALFIACESKGRSLKTKMSILKDVGR